MTCLGVAMLSKLFERDTHNAEQEISNEKRKSDELLYNILPADVASELKATGKSQPMRFESMTILFTDFKGFTELVASIPAITLVEELNDIFSQFDDIMAEEGFETQFNVQSADRDFLHIWTITEVRELHKICYNWKYGKYPGDSYVCFELFEQNDQTSLKLTHTVTQDFPDDIPEFERESGVPGWDYFIKTSLKNYLSNHKE